MFYLRSAQGLVLGFKLNHLYIWMNMMWFRDPRDPGHHSSQCGEKCPAKPSHFRIAPVFQRVTPRTAPVFHLLRLEIPWFGVSTSQRLRGYTCIGHMFVSRSLHFLGFGGSTHCYMSSFAFITLISFGFLRPKSIPGQHATQFYCPVTNLQMMVHTFPKHLHLA